MKKIINGLFKEFTDGDHTKFNDLYEAITEVSMTFFRTRWQSNDHAIIMAINHIMTKVYINTNIVSDSGNFYSYALTCIDNRLKTEYNKEQKLASREVSINRLNPKRWWRAYRKNNDEVFDEMFSTEILEMFGSHVEPPEVELDIPTAHLDEVIQKIADSIDDVIVYDALILDLPHKKIAEKHGISNTNTVKTRVHRAKPKIRENLLSYLHKKKVKQIKGDDDFIIADIPKWEDPDDMPPEFRNFTLFDLKNHEQHKIVNIAFQRVKPLLNKLPRRFHDTNREAQYWTYVAIEFPDLVTDEFDFGEAFRDGYMNPMGLNTKYTNKPELYTFWAAGREYNEAHKTFLDYEIRHQEEIS